MQRLSDTAHSVLGGIDHGTYMQHRITCACRSQLSLHYLRTRVGYLSVGFVHTVTDIVNHTNNLGSGSGCTLRKFSHLVSYNCKAASLLASASCFDGCIQRK